MMASVSGGLASMGCSVPYAIAAKFAFPGRTVVVCSGDGAMQMAGNAELITVAKYWKEWTDPRMIIVVLKNNDLNFVTWEMRAMEGDPRFAASQDIPDFAYADYAKSLGLKGLRLNRPEQITSVLTQAFAADRPVLIEVESDPNIPPLPPSITAEAAQTFASALIKEGTGASGPLWGSIKTMWQSLTGK